MLGVSIIDLEPDDVFSVVKSAAENISGTCFRMVGLWSDLQKVPNRVFSEYSRRRLKVESQPLQCTMFVVRSQRLLSVTDTLLTCTG